MTASPFNRIDCESSESSITIISCCRRHVTKTPYNGSAVPAEVTQRCPSARLSIVRPSDAAPIY